ncbi:MAG: hypothetical protein KY464_17290 [Gemmatimonadetes bacterium]|nr:hypothetical protein [Gemmatimonadota bacterium]
MIIEHRQLRPLVRGLGALVLLLLALTAVARPASSQENAAPLRLAPSDTVYELRLQDGSVLFGKVVSADPQQVVLVTQAGVRVELARTQIRAAAPIRGTVRDDGAVWVEDPNSTRLFFGPTGRALRAADGYIGAFELFLPFLSYGLTDRLTIAGGTPIVPEAIGRILYLAPKVQVIASERMNVSTGVLAFFDLASDAGADGGEEDSDVAGILYGAGTWGSADHAVTAGAGWGFAGSDVQNRPAFMLGGETRAGARVKLITENYMISYRETVYDNGGVFHAPGEQLPTVRPREETRYMGLLGGGIRIFGERLAGDLGIGIGVGDADFHCCVPLVNFVYNFGGGR